MLDCLYYVLSWSFSWLEGWTLEGEASIVLLIVSLQFWQRKKDQGFAVLFGIPVVTCIDGVFLFVLVILLCESSSYFSFCKLGK